MAQADAARIPGAGAHRGRPLEQADRRRPAASASRPWRRTAPTSWKSSTPTPWPTCSRSRSGKTPARPESHWQPSSEPAPADRALLHSNALTLASPPTHRRQRLSAQLRATVASRTAALQRRGVTPGLAVVLVGDNPASRRCMCATRSRPAPKRACTRCWSSTRPALRRPPCSRASTRSNRDPAIHGILVQLPLPSTSTPHKVIEAISPAKDVDGFHVASAGALMVGQPGFWPCTPYGCMKMLEAIGYDAARQARGGHRAQQHRGQAHGADAAAAKCHRHRLPQRHRRPGSPRPCRPT